MDIRDGETGTISAMRISKNTIRAKHITGELWEVEIEMIRVNS